MSAYSEQELVVGRVQEIGQFGATLKSDAYDGELFLHISEIPLKREQRLTDVVRRNQVLVVRTMREDKHTSRMFVSLKGISFSDSRRVLRSWKEENKAIAILKEALVRTNQQQELVDKIEEKAVEKFGSLSEAFRAAIETGSKAFSRLLIPPETARVLEEEIEKELLKKVYVEKRRVKIFFTDPAGIDKMRSLGSKFSGKSEMGVTLAIRTIAPPEYELIVRSPRPKKARTVAEDVLKKLEQETRKLGGQFSVS